MENIFIKRPIIIIQQSIEEDFVTKQIFVLTSHLFLAWERMNEAELNNFYGDWKSWFPEGQLDKIKPLKLNIFPEDRISELKEKLGSTGLFKNYDIHLYAITSNTYLPIMYRITFEGEEPLDIRKIFKGKREGEILGIPIDSRFYQNRESIIVHANDYNTSCGDLYKKGIFCYYLVSLSEFITKEKQEILTKIINDRYQLELFYYSFIIKYFPMMSIDVFKLYILNPADIAKVYPDLYIEPTKEESLLKKYELLADAKAGYKNFPEFEKYAPESTLESKSEKGVIRTIIKSIVLNVRYSLLIKINIRNLFEYLQVSAQIPFISTKLMVKRRFIILTKVYSSEDSDVDKDYEFIKQYISQLFYNTLIVVQKVGKNYIVTYIYDNGIYQSKIIWNEEKDMDFTHIIEFIDNNIAPLIRDINELDRKIFNSSQRLLVMNKFNVEYTGLYVVLIWKAMVTEAIFQEFKKMLRSDAEEHILKIIEEDIGSIKFLMLKGMTYNDPNLLETFISTNNYYEYLTDSQIRQKWDSLYNNRLVEVSHYATNIRFDIQNIQNQEFEIIYRYIIYLLFELEKKPIKQESKVRDKKLQVLKLYDPNLYQFKRFGSDLVYSRICQKTHQPVPYTQDEYEKLDKETKNKAVKYWNFTTNRPLYYICPDQRYPYLQFITEKHPLNYCLPCCMKVKKEKTKKDFIYNICMESHSYEGQIDSTSRYIMNYGKQLEINRISYLPDILRKYIKQSSKDINLPYNLFHYNGVDYPIDEIVKIVEKTKIINIPLKDILKFTGDSAKKWNKMLKIINNPQNYTIEYNHIKSIKLGPIILLANIQPHPIVEGIYRLARYYLENVKEIPVRFVTFAQLERLKTKIKNIKEKITKIPDYYLFGVPQEDLGAVNAIAMALELSVPSMTENAILYMRNHRDIDFMNLILGGTLRNYFKDLDDFLFYLHNSFIENWRIQGGGYFSQWNELFIDIAYWCFKKVILIIEDAEELSLILPQHRMKKYIVLIRRIKKQTLYGSPYIYYPVFVIIPKKFFNTFSIEKRIFSENDDFIRILLNLIQEEKKSIYPSLNIISNFYIHSYLINKKGFCYGVLTTLEKSGSCGTCGEHKIGRCGTFGCNEYISDKVYIPIEYTTIKTEKKQNTYQLSDLCDFQYWKRFIQKYNEIILIKSEEAGKFRVFVEKENEHEQNKREDHILPIYPFIKVDRLLIYKQKVIGAICQGIFFYFKPAELKQVIQEFDSGYNIRRSKNLFYFIYSPEEINKAIDSQPHKPPHLKDLEQAYNDYNIYEKFVTDFASYLDMEENIEIRKDIIKHINETNFYDANEYNKFLLYLGEIIHPNDVIIIAEQANNKDKKLLLQMFESTSYHFDRITANKIETSSKSEIKNIIDSIFKEKYGNHPSYNILIETLASDLVNPQLRKFLLEGIMIENVRDYFQFTKQPDTDIFVKIEE